MSEHVETPEAPFSELEALARPAGALRPAPGPWYTRLLRYLLGYLPVLLMGLLAAFTWWLVKNTPVAAEVKTVALPPQTVDYAMTGFVLSSYGPQGALRSRIEGELMQHYPATDTVEVQEVRLRSVDDAGRLMLGSAERAQSNADSTQVRLMGAARVSREAAPNGSGNGKGNGSGNGNGNGGRSASAAGRIEIRSEFLEILSAEQRVRSHLPVTLIMDNGELRAGAIDYSRRDRVAELGGRVTGQLRPGKAPP